MVYSASTFDFRASHHDTSAFGLANSHNKNRVNPIARWYYGEQFRLTLSLPLSYKV